MLPHTQPDGGQIRHLRAPVPVRFPEDATVPGTKLHLKLRTMLYAVMHRAFADRMSIGSDQFVYWNAADPRRSLAPDLFVRRGTPDSDFRSWKTWERGAPELAVEVISDSDASEDDWADKLRRYQELGVQELVRFDPRAKEGERLAVWDRVDGDLVERHVTGDRTPCATLSLWWVVQPSAGLEATLRLCRDAEGRAPLLTPAEAEEAAERRIAELEAELRRRGGG